MCNHINIKIIGVPRGGQVGHPSSPVEKLQS